MSSAASAGAGGDAKAKVLNVAKVNELLKQTAHHDKDEKYMATSDLTTELEGVEGAIDASLQVAIRNAILAQLEDSSTDVQTVAVKLYVLLLRSSAVLSTDLLTSACPSVCPR
jgi:hypothetical protein